MSSYFICACLDTNLMTSTNKTSTSSIIVDACLLVLKIEFFGMSSESLRFFAMASGYEIGTKGLLPCAMSLAIVGVWTRLASISTLGGRMVQAQIGGIGLVGEFCSETSFTEWRCQKRIVTTYEQNKKEEGKF